MANIYQNFQWTGLGTLSYTIPEASSYFIQGSITLPTPSNGQGLSSLVVTVSKNGSPFYTGQASSMGFRTTNNFAVNDVVTVVFSSAASVDQGLNNIRSTIVIGEGQ